MGALHNTTEIELLLTTHYEKYYRLAYSYLRNEQDALDAVQESAYRATRDYSKLKDTAYLSTWLYRIVINVSLDILRKQKREMPLRELPELPIQDTYNEYSLKEFLDKLDDKSKTIVLLRYFEDLKLEDIANIVGENLNTVKARLYRSLKKLKLDIKDELFL